MIYITRRVLTSNFILLLLVEESDQVLGVQGQEWAGALWLEHVIHDQSKETF